MQCAAQNGRYSALALLCLMLQAEITYAKIAQHAKQLLQAHQIKEAA